MRVRDATDDLLMQAISQEDQAAFSELIRRHRRWVCDLMRAIVHDREYAEDLTQEAFARVHRYAGDFRPQGQFTAWLKRIATNLARNALRERLKIGSLAMISLSGLPDDSIRSPCSDPMEALLSRGMQQEIRAAIQMLPDEQRLVLIMRYFGDMSVQDIAWAMKCPEGTIKSRLFHGLRRVRETVTDTQTEGE